MQRINLLIQKLGDMAGNEQDNSLLDIDLMLDYTRVLYADLLEVRKNKLLAAQVGHEPVSTPSPAIQHVEASTEAPVSESEAYLPDIADVPAIDIRTGIGINDKYLYISELFGDDKAAYEDAIRQLNTFSNLQQAIKYAEHELSDKYKWDKEQSTVQSFYNLLSNSFPSI